MLFYLLFAILAGFAEGTSLLILGLVGTLISLLKPSTLRKKIVSLIFVLSLLLLRMVYVADDLTLLHLILALLAPLIYVAVGIESVETMRTFWIGLFIFTVISTLSSGSYVLTVTILVPTLFGLLIFYVIKTMKGGSKRWAEKS